MSGKGMESEKSPMKIHDLQRQDPGHLKNNEDVNMETDKGDIVKPDTDFGNDDLAGDVNMEAAITSGDVLRAGGFGATDDIGSFLPVATDSTDFEASLRDARGFEEPQGETPRPGLGWSEATESENSLPTP